MDGYYNFLLSFIDTAVEEGFISPDARHIIVSAPTAKELVKKMEVTSKLLSYFLNFCICFSMLLIETRFLNLDSDAPHECVS